MSGLCQSLFLNLFFQIFDIESLAKFSKYYLEVSFVKFKLEKKSNYFPKMVLKTTKVVGKKYTY
jgi:hypothetical protein